MGLSTPYGAIGIFLIGAMSLATTVAAGPPGLFSSLDEDRDGYLSNGELQAGLEEGGWSAEDRDRDGRVAPDEFDPPGDAPPPAVSARELLGMPVHDRTGARVGVVSDLVVGARGKVLALDVGGARVPWRHARLGPLYIAAGVLAGEGVAKGKTRRASELLGKRVRVGLPARDAVVEDLVILHSGEVASVVLRGGGFYPWSRVWKRTKGRLPAGVVPP